MKWQRHNTEDIYCIIKEGSPGKLEIYLINDFGELPPEPQGDPKWARLSLRLVLVNHSNTWRQVADYKTDLGVIAFMFKLADESGTYDYYGLETYEYADKANIEPPY